MRLAAILLLIVLIAACTPETPTPTVTPPPVTVESGTSPAGVISLTIPVPAPGTLVAGSSNVPEGGRPPIEFTTVYFSRTGGVSGQELSVEVRRDGTLIRDGETSTVPEATIADIDNRLNLIDFYGIQGIFTGQQPPDAFFYSLTVESNVGSRTINAQDGLIPPELMELYSFFMGLGAS
ncbi:MAG TPA: hypothetical protein VK003_07310 [Oceanobacillus sp.]|nr:hypothetical protein [Oceanobacillus sp.]